LFGANNALYKWVGEESFYAYLGVNGPRVFDDSLFRKMYCDDNGRPCVIQWRLAATCLLQMFDHCSDEEAIERTKFDDRWKVALDLKPGEKPFAKSTLQEFRARLILNEATEKVFLRISLDEARKFGLIKGKKVTTALDTTPITGRGAVKDTYNLVADGIKNLARVLSQATEERLNTLIQRYGLSRYFPEGNTSLKGSAEIDWTNDQERRNFLNTLVADARRLLEAAKAALDNVSDKRQKLLAQAIALMERLITQDTEPDPKDPQKVQITQGTAKNRVISVTDPDMAHGRKSSSKRFDGHKLATATEPSAGLITALKVLPGNAPDKTNALELIEATEANTGEEVAKTIGDCAYGDGASRADFAEEGRPLVAKVPAPPSNEPFHKAHFKVDTKNGCVTCPAGQTTHEFEFVKASSNGAPVKKFYFSIPVCQGCVNKEQCLQSKGKEGGRTVTLHPQEDLLQAAREYQQTPEFRQDMKDRQRAEHGFARFMQFGMRQARYFGRAKVEFQGLVTAALINLLIVMGFSQLNSMTVEEALAMGGQECPTTSIPARGRAAEPAIHTTKNGRQEVDKNRLVPDGVRGAPQSQSPPRRAPQ
jgi:hypothetical protein